MLQFIHGFYELIAKPQVWLDCEKELSKAHLTKCHGLILQTLTSEMEQAKARKACLKVVKVAEQKGVKMRPAVLSRANLCIRMDL